MKDHDVVIGQRSADQRSHGSYSSLGFLHARRLWLDNHNRRI
jgi:hypothetical protein